MVENSGAFSRAYRQWNKESLEYKDQEEAKAPWLRPFNTQAYWTVWEAGIARNFKLSTGAAEYSNFNI